MLTHFTKILIIPALLGLLTSCSSNTPEDGRYGLIQGGFPRLNNVPDRPLLPSQESIERRTKKLEQDRLEAASQASKNLVMAHQ